MDHTPAIRRLRDVQAARDPLYLHHILRQKHIQSGPPLLRDHLFRVLHGALPRCSAGIFHQPHRGGIRFVDRLRILRNNRIIIHIQDCFDFF